MKYFVSTTCGLLCQRVAVVLMVVGNLGAWGTTQADDGERLFAIRIQPLLKSKCLGCHGGDVDDIKGEYDVRQRHSLLAGGESGDLGVIPGKPNEGTLIEAIAWDGLEMPPKENDRLTDDEVKLFRQWIEAGAPWPDEATQAKYRAEEAQRKITSEGMLFETSGGTSEQWTNRRYRPEDLWAFQPVRPSSDLLPENLRGGAAIDHLINRSLKAKGLTASATAPPLTLIRRASLDLTGLPPTPEETSRFLSAFKENPDLAWSQLIDRLLASPAYGERWGRHWLDVTRYADTGGMSNDYERSNMWRYRDYVIRAFNQDKPYDQFIVEQLAGDELADQSYRKRKQANQKQVQQAQFSGDYTAEEAEWVVATGFLRLGPWDNAMVMADEARQMYLDDVVNITGQTFLAQTLRCCKCHDHKFDPIPTRDYYRIYAAFSTTRMAERNVPHLPSENLDQFKEGQAHVQRMLDFAVKERDKLVNKRETAARAWYEENELPYKNEKDRKNLPDDQKPPRHVGLNYIEQGQLKVREQDVWIWTRRLERYQPMAQSVYNAKFVKLAGNAARKLRIKRMKQPDQPPLNHILVGGAISALGDKVSPGVLSAISIANDKSTNRGLLTEAPDGRRLGLARWIANEDNPLTTRSIVNRIWQYHFGKPIAANPNNFGAKGGKPSHPDLLDYLANELVAGGWKLKRLHRMIMLSDVYRRSSAIVEPEKVAESDPNNQLLSHFPRRRLSAEEIRDSLLAITGELQDSDGGLPIMPEINMEVALQPRMIQFSLAPAYQPSPAPQLRNRRSVYAYQVRGQADPFTEIFNQPNPNESCEQRETAAVTPQVFTMLNSDTMTDRSVALALRLQKEANSLEQQIHRAFQLVLSRQATDKEQQRLVDYVNQMTTYHQSHEPAVRDYPRQITRSLVEEFSGKPFEYTEILPVFENYQPDQHPSQVSAETRALADLCLLLFNTNEFIYVD